MCFSDATIFPIYIYEGKMNISDIGKQIVLLRTEKGLSQKDLSQMIPVSQSTLSRWENGTIIPHFHQIERICDVLNVSLEQLISQNKSEYEELRKRNLRQKCAIVILTTVLLVGVLFILLPRYEIVGNSEIYSSSYGEILRIYVEPVFFFTENSADVYCRRITKRYNERSDLTAVEIVFVKKHSSIETEDDWIISNTYFLKKMSD